MSKCTLCSSDSSASSLAFCSCARPLVQRKLTALAFGTLLTLDASLLTLCGEMLSFCVSVIAESEPSSGPDVPARMTIPSASMGEHGSFAARLNETDLDPCTRIELRQTLQECMARCSAAYGDELRVQLQGMDQALLEQVRHAFNGTS